MKLEGITRAAQESARRARRALLAGGVLAVLAGTAFGFATAALYLGLAAWAGPALACLVIAAAYGLVALGVWLAMRGADRPAPPGRDDAGRPGPEPDAVSELIATFLAGVRAGRQGFGRDGR